MDPTPNMQTAGAGPAEYKECFKCSFRGDTDQASCPKCGKKLRTSKNIRVRGGVQLVTGLFLVAMMAGLTVFIWYLTVNAAKDPEQARKLADERTLFTGMYALFAVIALFGLNGIVMGTWQVITGRRNKVLMWVMFVLLALILIACFATAFVVQ